LKTIKIEIRQDLDILNQVLKTGKVEISDDLKGTYIEECTAPAYEAMGPFLKGLAIRSFADRQEVIQALEKWKVVAKQHGLCKEFRSMWLNGDDIIEVLTDGIGGNLQLAWLVKADT